VTQQEQEQHNGNANVVQQEQDGARTKVRYNKMQQEYHMKGKQFNFSSLTPHFDSFLINFVYSV